MDPNSTLNDRRLTAILLAILVKRLGGSVEITQADIDDIAFHRLMEESRGDGSLRFSLEERKFDG